MAKICMYVSHICDIGGEQRVSAIIANELAKEHTLVIYTQDTIEQQRENPFHLSDSIELREITQPSYPFWNRTLRRIIRDINENTNLLYKNKGCLKLLEFAYFQKDWQERLLQELSKDDFDVILAVSGGNTLQIGMIADRLKCKTIGWEHNTYQAYFETKGKYFYHQELLFKKALERIGECVVLNDRIRLDYKQAFGKDCKVIYNPRSFVSEEKTKLTNKEFVTMGRLTEQKGYELLIDAYAKFAKENDDYHLTIVGDGELREKIDDLIISNNLTNRITITGYQKNVLPYLLNASAYLLSSKWEGFPMVLTEAFEVGLPVVAFDIVAVGPLVDESKEGFLAEAFDTDMYAKRMLEYVKLPQEEKQRMSQAAIEKARSLSIEHITEQWKAILF